MPFRRCCVEKCIGGELDWRKAAVAKRRSVANMRLAGPKFGDGNWHCLADLVRFEEQLLAARQQDKRFSDEVRIDNSPGEKLRRDELLPFLDLAQHEKLASTCIFRKPQDDRGIDIEYAVAGARYALQITTAYPTWMDASGKAMNGGYQHRLHMEKLTGHGMLWGTGPYERRDGVIAHDESCTTSEQELNACRVGLVEALKLKSRRGLCGVGLLIGARGFYQKIFDPNRFNELVEASVRMVPPTTFDRIVVVDYGPRFFWTNRTH